MKIGWIFVLHGRKEKIVSHNLALIDCLITDQKILGEIAFLEGEHQSLEAVMEQFLAQGVEEIIFVPVLLFAATHVREDLPQRAQAFLAKKVPYHILEPLVGSKAIEKYLLQKASEKKESVLLIAHGTPHYEEPLNQLNKLAQTLEKKLQKKVHAGTYIGKQPYLDVLEKHSEPLLILPIFLTNGVIVEKIKQKIYEYREHQDFISTSLEDSEALSAAILERMREVDVPHFNRCI